MRVRIAGFLGLLALARTVQAVDITACGAVVAAGSVGVLQADLDCTAFEARACLLAPSVDCSTNSDCPPSPYPGLTSPCVPKAVVHLGERAQLQLNGHSITTAAFQWSIVKCAGRCAVNGPGVITGAASACVVADRKPFSVADVQISGCTYGIAEASLRAALTATNVTITGCSQEAIRVGNVAATNLTTNQNRSGIVAAGRLDATNVTANDNSVTGIFARKRLRGVNVTANNNGYAGVIAMRGATLVGFHAEQNLEGGIRARTLTLTDSTVTGNHFDGELIDILSARRPRLVNTVCDHSAHFNIDLQTASDTWTVCTLD